MWYLITGLVCFVLGALVVIYYINRALKEKEEMRDYFEATDIYDLHPYDRPKIKKVK
jgi:hypothetical protein